LAADICVSVAAYRAQAAARLKTSDRDNDERGLKALAKLIGGSRISARITIFASLLRLT
jgi:hypothetical protein